VERPGNTPNWVGRAETPFQFSASAPGFPPAAVPELDISASVSSSQPGLMELLLAFAKMSLAGFGGVGLGTARRHRPALLVDGRAEQFNETFVLCDFLPGPNIVNLSVVFGSRFGGIVGGLAAGAFWVSLALSDENR
jgi:chromate transporter